MVAYVRNASQREVDLGCRRHGDPSSVTPVSVAQFPSDSPGYLAMSEDGKNCGGVP